MSTLIQKAGFHIGRRYCCWKEKEDKELASKKKQVEDPADKSQHFKGPYVPKKIILPSSIVGFPQPPSPSLGVLYDGHWINDSPSPNSSPSFCPLPDKGGKVLFVCTIKLFH